MSVVTLPYLLLQDMYSVLETMLGGSHRNEDMFSPRVWQNVLRVAKDTRHTLTGAKVIMTSGYIHVLSWIVNNIWYYEAVFIFAMYVH